MKALFSSLRKHFATQPESVVPSRRRFLGALALSPLLGLASPSVPFTYMLPEYYHQGWVQGSHTVYDRKKVLHHCNDYEQCDWLTEHPGGIIKKSMG